MEQNKEKKNLGAVPWGNGKSFIKGERKIKRVIVGGRRFALAILKAYGFVG